MSGRRNELGLLTTIVAMLSFSFLQLDYSNRHTPHTPCPVGKPSELLRPTSPVSRPRPKITWSCVPLRYRSDIHANQYGVQRILPGHIYIHREVLTLKSSANAYKKLFPTRNSLFCFHYIARARRICIPQNPTTQHKIQVKEYSSKFLSCYMYIQYPTSCHQISACRKGEAVPKPTKKYKKLSYTALHGTREGCIVNLPSSNFREYSIFFWRHGGILN